MANLLYRTSSTPTKPTTTSVKNAPLTNLEVDGNFKSVNDDLDTKVTTADVAQTIAGTKTFSNALILSTQASQVSHAVRAEREIAAGDGLSGGGDLTDDRTISLKDISAGSEDVGAVAYNGTVRAVGKFYGGITDPNATTRLNFDGLLRATRLQAATLGVGTSAPAEDGDMDVAGTVTAAGFSGPLTGNVTGNASTATKLATGRQISLDGAVIGAAVTFDGSSNVSITTTMAANSVALGTQTTGNYVAGLTAGTGVTISGTAGEGWSPTVSIGQNVSTSSNVRFNSLGVGTNASATSGEIRATNQITSYYSDERLKEDIEEIGGALQKVMSLRGVTYKPNSIAESLGYKKQSEVGVIAQDVEKVLPEAVKPAPFDIMLFEGAEISKSGENYKTVQYEKLVPLLIEAIKELNREVEQLKQK
jgi:hypothetical protein